MQISIVDDAAVNSMNDTLCVAQVRALGFRFAIYPAATMLPAALAMRAALETLKRDGTDEATTQGHAPREFFEMVGLQEALAIDERSGSDAPALSLRGQRAAVATVTHAQATPTVVPGAVDL